ncbi:hypothetical protein HDU91_001423 [Kappamyces sp. JEL0680]|nr:hypothetical protein HDU91_001423 [Kappamyces sp. JEL0680]
MLTCQLSIENFPYRALAVLYLVANLVSLVRVYVRDTQVRKGYLPVLQLASEVVTGPVTGLEALIFATAVALAGVLSFEVNAVLQPYWAGESAEYGVLVSPLALALGALFYVARLALAFYLVSSAPRYSFLSLALANVVLGKASFELLMKKDDSQAAYTVYAALGLVVLSIVLELVKPVRHAAVLEAMVKDGRSLSLEETASPIAFVMFMWVNDLLKKGYQKPLEQEDLPHLHSKDKMQNIIERWEQCKKPQYSPIYNMLCFTANYAVFQFGMAVLSTILDFSKPFFINRLLVWIQNKKPDEPIYFGIFLLAGLFVADYARELLYGQLILSATHWGRQVRSAFIYDIFKKSLRRAGGADGDSAEDGKKASQGKIVSLMSSDVHRLILTLSDLHYVTLDIPISLALSLSGLIYLMGVSSLAGMMIVILSGPVAAWASSSLYQKLSVIRYSRDRRIQLTNEALLGIRVIK